MIDGLRIAVTLLTIVPLRSSASVDRTRAGWAMAFAPLVGLALGVAAALLLFLVRAGVGFEDTSLVPALVTLLGLAVVTGGLHLDGLADLADGFGARRDREGTLTVMRTPTVGAFAVVAVVMAIGLQASALTLAVERHHGTLALILAIVAGRTAVTVACAGRAAPARPEGLGALVAGSVPRARALAVVALAALLAVVLGLLDPHAGGVGVALHAVLALAGGLLAAAGLRLLAVRKLGGINGDVLGALVETATTVTLLLVAAEPFS
ncbi:MAG: adenosylcobinamide-GDP ribazoletransferase [Frankiaceae bacterium]|nr:adenosylcobinamide-GDP ribazoletransferase [Frankiaceae bacterium]MDQ1649896.1 adenosylcobinamide-GDP ribazoletransferase [Frankiaceae bacterium]